MMEAVARGKAHWLFGAGTDGLFNGKKRPQEDMVTSTVFGSIWLMSREDRRRAIEVVLGTECVKAAGFSKANDIEISFWKKFPLEGRVSVEPDILLSCAGKTLIVEVKWHASLSKCQIEQQIEAVRRTTIVRAVVMLGEAGVDKKVLDIPCFRRTWRDVSGELQTWSGKTDNALDRWAEKMREFLQKTDMGRVFGGLDSLAEPETVVFRFSKPGHPPWMDSAPSAVESVQYKFEREQ